MGSKGTGINNIPGNSSKEFCYTAKSMLSRTGIRWSGKPVGIGRETFGRYSAVVNDILFDYFLASRFQDYAGLPLKRFSRRFYTALAWNYRHLPERFQGFIWHFILTDRLCRYASLTGIQQSLEIMTRYRGLQIDPAQTPLFMQEHGERLQKIFREFFPELHERCKQSIYLKS